MGSQSSSLPSSACTWAARHPSPLRATCAKITARCVSEIAAAVNQSGEAAAQTNVVIRRRRRFGRRCDAKCAGASFESAARVSAPVGKRDASRLYKVQIQFAATSERVIKSEITLGAFTAAGCAKSRAPRRIAFGVLNVNFAPISAADVQSNAFF